MRKTKDLVRKEINVAKIRLSEIYKDFKQYQCTVYYLKPLEYKIIEKQLKTYETIYISQICSKIYPVKPSPPEASNRPSSYKYKKCPKFSAIP